MTLPLGCFFILLAASKEEQSCTIRPITRQLAIERVHVCAIDKNM